MTEKGRSIRFGTLCFEIPIAAVTFAILYWGLQLRDIVIYAVLLAWIVLASFWAAHSFWNVFHKERTGDDQP